MQNKYFRMGWLSQVHSIIVKKLRLVSFHKLSNINLWWVTTFLILRKGNQRITTPCKCPITNDQLPKQPFLIQLFVRVKCKEQNIAYNNKFNKLFKIWKPTFIQQFAYSVKSVRCIMKQSINYDLSFVYWPVAQIALSSLT